MLGSRFPLKLLESIPFALFAIVIAATSRWATYADVLPSIMRDEYLYRLSTDPSVPNHPSYGTFLFDFVYSFVYIAGADFYAWVKVLNTIFLAIAAWFIFLTARNLLGKRFALLAPLLFLLSPLGQYGSYLLPESLFFAISSISMLLLLRMFLSEGRERYFNWAGLMLSLLCLSLVKPHGVFTFLVLAPIAAYAILRERKLTFQNYLVASALTFGLFMAKGAIVSALEPETGAALFSVEYDNFFLKVIGDILAVNLEQNTMTILTVLGLVISLSSPLYAGLAVKGSNSKALAPHELFERSAIMLFIATIAAVIVFTFLVTAGGDDHSNRLLLRYLEYTLPFVALTLFSRFLKGAPARLALFSQSVVFAMLMAQMIGGSVEPSVVDSTLLLGLSFPIPLFFTFALVIAGAYFAVRQTEIGKKLLVAIFSLAMLSGGIAASSAQVDENSAISDFDLVGQELHLRPELFNSSDSVILADNWLLAHVTAFWSGYLLEVQAPPNLDLLDCETALTRYTTVVYLTSETIICDRPPAFADRGAVVFIQDD